MNEYEKYTDEELVARIQKGEDEIMEYILNKYKNLVMKHVNSVFILGGDSDDLIQEGMIGLFKAIMTYNSEKDASFLTFATICVSRKILSAIDSAACKKHYPLNQYISIYRQTSDVNGEDGDLELLQNLKADSTVTPELNLLNKEILEEVNRIVEKDLSSLERDVFKLYLAGMDYVSIAKILERDEKSTDNALQRGKNKIKKAMSSLLDN